MISAEAREAILRSLKGIESYLESCPTNALYPEGSANNLAIIKGMIDIFTRSSHERLLVSGIEKAGEAVSIMFSLAIHSSMYNALPLLLRYAKQFAEELVDIKRKEFLMDVESSNSKGEEILREFGQL